VKKSTTFLSIFACLVLTTFCYASPLKVEISLNEHSSLKWYYNNGQYQNPAILVLATKITNISDQDQKIPVWDCSYGKFWVASSPAIITGIESCRKNSVGVVVLKPTESYSRDLLILVSSKAQAGSLTFKMGYNLWSGTHFDYYKNKSVLKEVIWSNPITIEVNNDMLRNQEEWMIRLSK